MTREDVLFYKAEYLGFTDYYDTFEELKRFYDHEECEDLFELQEALREEAEGMAYPILKEFVSI